MDEENTGADGARVGTGGSLSADAAGRPVISDDSNVEDGSVLSIDHGQQDVGAVQQVASIQPTMQAGTPGATVVEPMVNTTSTLSTTGAPVVSSQSVSSNTIPNTVANLDQGSISSINSGLNSSLSANSVSANAPQPLPRPISRFQSADQLVSQTFAAGGTSVQPNISGSVQQLVQNSPMPSPYSGQSAFSIANSAGSVAGNEDVVLALNGKAKSSKKKILLFLAAIGVVGLITGICVIVMNGGFLNSGVSIDKMHASLNRYANYLLYETESDAPLINNIDWSADKIEEKISLDGSNEGGKYFDELVGKYDDFLTVFTKDADFSSSLDDSGLKFYDGLTNGIKDSLDTLTQYAVTKNMSVDDMVELCLQIGRDGMLSRVDELYGGFLYDADSAIYEYAQIKNEIAEIVGELYSYYTDNQCVNSGAFNDQCIEDHKYDEAAVNYQRNLEDLTLKQFIKERKIKDDVIDFSKMLYQSINVQEEDE